MTRLILSVLVCFLGACASTQASKPGGDRQKSEPRMQLGNFSVSLLVKDLAASRAFYEKLGFREFPNTASKNMVILQNDTCTIGLFHGGIEKNTLTFNPGWDRTCATLPRFDDVREIQRTLRDRGITPVLAADESTSGPAFLILADPDGNPIFIDQHVPAPSK